VGWRPAGFSLKAIQRLRQKCGEAIRREIADTVYTEEEIAGEFRYLIEVLQTCRSRRVLHD
jgi:hypothetical protein